MTNKILLPEVLQPFSEQLLQTRRTFIRLSPKTEPPQTPWTSTIGGLPYWPNNQPFPTGTDGSPLLLLAQINFDELPTFPPFPDQGLLQFFISSDDVYGYNFDDPFDQSNFRIVFHPSIEKKLDHLVSSFSFLSEENTGPFQQRQAFALDFELQEELMPRENHQFEKQLGPDFFDQFGDKKWQIIDDYREVASGMGHKIGGYPYFTQSDPRTEDSLLELLLQVDTDETLQIMWGDMGVANFFIHPADLQKLDFSKVYFHWDCY